MIPSEVEVVIIYPDFSQWHLLGFQASLAADEPLRRLRPTGRVIRTRCSRWTRR